MAERTSAGVREAVFVVHPSPDERARLGALLLQLGCEPVPLSDGDACLAALAARPLPPLLVLLPLELPGARGDEVCGRIKENPAWADVAVILTTSGANPAEAMYCWRAAADDALVGSPGLAQLDVKLAAVRAAGQRLPPAAPRGKRLLMVEDSRFYRTLVGGALEHEGFEVSYAHDLSGAFVQLEARAQEFDGFVFDLVLPDGNGLQLAERLRALPDLDGRRMLVISAFPQESQAHARVLRLSGAALLEKRRLPADVLVRRIVAHFSAAAPDMRATERAPFFSTVQFAPAPGTEPLTGFSYDVSPGGIFVRTLTPLPAGSPVHLAVSAPGHAAPLRAEGTVAWSNPFRRATLARVPVGMGLKLRVMDAALLEHVPRLSTASLRPAV